MIEKLKRFTLENFWFNTNVLSITLLSLVLFWATNGHWLLFISGAGGLYFAMFAANRLRTYLPTETITSKWLKMTPHQRMRELYDLKINVHYVSAIHSTFLLILWAVLEIGFHGWAHLLLWSLTGLLWVVSIYKTLKTAYDRRQWENLNLRMAQQRKNIILQNSMKLSRDLETFIKEQSYER